MSYDLILMALGTATATGIYSVKRMLSMLNRLNSGNPHYTPYQVEDARA